MQTVQSECILWNKASFIWKAKGSKNKKFLLIFLVNINIGTMTLSYAELLDSTRIGLGFYCFAGGIFFSVAAASEVSCELWLKTIMAYFMFKMEVLKTCTARSFLPLLSSAANSKRRRKRIHSFWLQFDLNNWTCKSATKLANFSQFFHFLRFFE